MILEARNKAPFIHFGFNKINTVAYLNEPLNVYLNTLYNEAEYNSFAITSAGATVVEVSPYHYKLTFTEVGAKKVDLKITNNIETIELDSNTLNLSVECRNNYVFSAPCNSQYLPIL